MTAPMAGFGPMAFSPFPYGPVPSSGIPSLLYVDLFNDQTAAGKKSWIITHQTSTLLQWADWGVTKDATTRVIIEDGTSSNGAAVPVIRRIQSSTLSGLDAYQGTTDTGTNPINVFRARLGASSSVVTRPLFSFQNNSTDVASVSAKGAWTYTVIAETSVAETLATWKTSDNATGSIIFENRSSTDAAFIAQIRGVSSAATQGLCIVAQGTTDSGTTALLQILPRISTNTSVVTRPLVSLLNNTTTVAQVSAAGELTIDGGTAPALTMGGRINTKSYTVATLPAAGVAGGVIYVSDAAVAPCLAFSNGTNWKRCDNAATTVV